MSSQKAATYTHLRDGSWGVRVPGTTVAGASIPVRKRDGKTKNETVSKVLWTGRDSKTGQTVSLCSIRSSAASGTHGGKREMCADCGQYPGVVECSDSSGFRALCCRACAKMSSFERSFA